MLMHFLGGGGGHSLVKTTVILLIVSVDTFDITVFVQHK